jgi:hypothetical protein
MDFHEMIVPRLAEFSMGEKPITTMCYTDRLSIAELQ